MPQQLAGRRAPPQDARRRRRPLLLRLRVREGTRRRDRQRNGRTRRPACQDRRRRPVDHRSQEWHTQRVHARARPPARHDGDRLQCVPHRSAAAPDPHRSGRPGRAFHHSRRQERHHFVPRPAVADGAARRRARHRPAAEPGEAGDRRSGRLRSHDRSLSAPDNDILRAALLQAAALGRRIAHAAAAGRAVDREPGGPARAQRRGRRPVEARLHPLGRRHLRRPVPAARLHRPADEPVRRHAPAHDRGGAGPRVPHPVALQRDPQSRGDAAHVRRVPRGDLRIGGHLLRRRAAQRAARPSPARRAAPRRADACQSVLRARRPRRPDAALEDSAHADCAPQAAPPGQQVRRLLPRPARGARAARLAGAQGTVHLRPRPRGEAGLPHLCVQGRRLARADPRSRHGRCGTHRGGAAPSTADGTAEGGVPGCRAGPAFQARDGS